MVQFEEKLNETLESLGIHESVPDVLCHGGEGNSIKKVHKKTNEKLLECLDNNSLGDCVHVTGEMRALKDPFHRYVCDEIRLREKNLFKIVFNSPAEKTKGKTTSLVRWNLANWTADNQLRKWQEELRTIYSIANRSVKLYAFDTSDEIQYSVFGNQYVLLQEKHSPGVSEKNTWLLKSDKVNSLLLEKANEKIHQSFKIDEGYYRKFTRNINGPSSMYVLNLLKDRGSIPYYQLLEDNLVKDYSYSPNEMLESLDVMNFIAIDKDKLASITKPGREFVDGL